MPEQYRVTKDGTTIQEQYATRTNRSTGEVYHLNRATVYNEGDVLSEDRIAPSLLEAIKNGTAKISDSIELVEKTKSEPAKVKATKTRKTTSKKKSEEE